MKALLESLVSAFGPSGQEEDVRSLIRSEVETLADDIRVDVHGNLFVHKRGAGRKIMLAAHMDVIGVIVTQIEENGLLRFSPVGFVTPKVLLGQRARFANGAIGVFSHDGGVEAELLDKNVPDTREWYIDMGVTGRGQLPVGVGDIAVIASRFQDLGGRWVGSGFDDRLGCAVLIETLRRLTASPHDLYFVFTVQEELGARGAQVAAFDLKPDIGIAVDVTSTGDAPHTRQPLAVRLGAGPAIKVADMGMIAHPRLRQAMIEVAETQGIPYQLEVLRQGSTDASAIQLAGAGAIAGAICIPTRYIHTPSEMADAGDIEAAATLLTAVLSSPLDGV